MSLAATPLNLPSCCVARLQGTHGCSQDLPAPSRPSPYLRWKIRAFTVADLQHRMGSPAFSFHPKSSYKKYYGQASNSWGSISSHVSMFNTSNHYRRTEMLSEKQMNIACKCLSRSFKEPSVVDASSMDEIYDILAHRLLAAASLSRTNEKYIVGLAGPPGAGKSTAASKVASRTNVLWQQKTYGTEYKLQPTDVAISVPMDGFHLYRSQLDAMEDPKEAHARRGAHWTFDPARLLSYLISLRREGLLYLPSFDHGVGDPVENEIFVSPLHKIVIVEGNYLLFDEGTWKDLSSVFDERWYLDVDIDLAMRRVEKRHILTGQTPELAKQRVEYNDRKNAELIMKTKNNANLLIHSVDDISINEVQSADVSLIKEV